MFCTRCGAEAKGGAVFCTRCGAPILQPGNDRTAVMQKHTKSNKLLFMVLGIVIFLGLAIAATAVIAVRRFSTKTPQNPLLIQTHDTELDLSKGYENLISQLNEKDLIGADYLRMKLSNNERFSGSDLTIDDIAIWYVTPYDAENPQYPFLKDIEVDRYAYESRQDYITAQGISDVISDKEVSELDNYLEGFIKYDDTSLDYCIGLYVDGKLLTKEELDLYCDKFETLYEEEGFDAINGARGDNQIFDMTSVGRMIFILPELEDIDRNMGGLLLAGYEYSDKLSNGEIQSMYIISYPLNPRDGDFSVTIDTMINRSQIES